MRTVTSLVIALPTVVTLMLLQSPDTEAQVGDSKRMTKPDTHWKGVRLTTKIVGIDGVNSFSKSAPFWGRTHLEDKMNLIGSRLKDKS